MKPTLWLLGLGMAATTFYSFVAPDAPLFAEPALARIVFFHLPSAFVCSALVLAMGWLGARYLLARKPKHEVMLGAVMELAALFGLFTMLTGILFSRVQWGDWWHWDARQSSFLLVLALLAAGLALRSGFSDERRRAIASAGYALTSMPAMLFLIFVFPRLEQVQRTSLHPTQSVAQNLFDPAYRAGIYGAFAMLAIAAFVIYRLRARAGLIELELEQRDGMDQLGGGDSADDRVVRPVAVSSKRE